MRLIWDLETDGFLPNVTKIHSLLMKDVDTSMVYSLHTGNSEYPPSNMTIEEVKLGEFAPTRYFPGHAADKKAKRK